MQYVNSHQRITIRHAERLVTTISRPTIKKRFSELVALGLLVRNGKGRDTWYNKLSKK
jgi:predicted HTH transcriptional regulator